MSYDDGPALSLWVPAKIFLHLVFVWIHLSAEEVSDRRPFALLGSSDPVPKETERPGRGSQWSDCTPARHRGFSTYPLSWNRIEGLCHNATKTKIADSNSWEVWISARRMISSCVSAPPTISHPLPKLKLRWNWFPLRFLPSKKRDIEMTPNRHRKHIDLVISMPFRHPFNVKSNNFSHWVDESERPLSWQKNWKTIFRMQSNTVRKNSLWNEMSEVGSLRNLQDMSFIYEEIFAFRRLCSFGKLIMKSSYPN